MLSPIYQVARQEFLPANFWVFRMQNDPEIEFKVKNVTLPFEKLNHKTLSTGEKVWDKWEGIESFTVEFYEQKTFATYNYFEEWFDAFYDKTRRVFRVLSPTDINALRGCTITFSYTGTGLVEVPIKTFVFSNVRVTEIGEVSLGYESGDPLTYTVTFVADEYTTF